MQIEFVFISIKSSDSNFESEVTENRKKNPFSKLQFHLYRNKFFFAFFINIEKYELLTHPDVYANGVDYVQ